MKGPIMMVDHLIIVCCHAIYIGGSQSGDSDADSERRWAIEPFQKGETSTFMNHAKAGLEALMEDDRGLLVFSGGPTKRPRTSLNEGQSYLVWLQHCLGNTRENLCKDNGFFKYPIDVSRITVEPYATDSYQNVLFSLIQFHLYAGTWPRRVTVITHEFKRARFMECHFPAVGLLSPFANNENLSETTRSNFALIGINPPEEITPLQSLVRGEMSNGIGLWKQDFYGVGEELARKRRNRGWFPGMEEDIFFNKGLDPVVEDLLRWDGGAGNELFSRIEALPWFHENVRKQREQ